MIQQTGSVFEICTKAPFLNQITGQINGLFD